MPQRNTKVVVLPLSRCPWCTKDKGRKTFVFRCTFRIQRELVDKVRYSGGPHIRFPFCGDRCLRISSSGAPLERNPWSGALKLTLPGPREGSSIVNVDLVVMAAAVQQHMHENADRLKRITGRIPSCVLRGRIWFSRHVTRSSPGDESCC